MERIRIIKRKRNKGSGIIWGILIVVILLGAAAWLLIDRDVIDPEEISLTRESDEMDTDEMDSDEMESYDRYRDADEPGRFEENPNADELQQNPVNDEVQTYVSFVNREVVPAESIEFQTKQKAASLLEKAVNEIEKASISGDPNNSGTGDNASVTPDSNEIAGVNPAERSGSDSIDQQNMGDSRYSSNESLIEAGNKLVEIQERKYPSLSRMGEVLDNSLNNLEETDEGLHDDLKEFFIASSSLLQEMDNERNELSYNKKMSYGNLE